MHERTRRNLCRCLFLLLCVLPTAGVVALVVYRHTPLNQAAQRRAWQLAAWHRFGLITNIQRVSQPAAGVTLLEGVELLDPETRQRLARVRVLELARTDHGQLLLASQPEVEEGQFLRLWQVLHERILRGPPLADSLQVASRELTLLGAPGQTYTDVRCQVEPHEAGVEVLIDFRVAGVEMPAAAQLRILRNRQLSPPATAWQLSTGSAPLPCSVFSRYLPVLERLGPSCRFAGTVWTNGASRDSSGEIAGRFVDVDLDRLLEPFPHKMSGTVEVVLRRARFQHGRLEEADGSIAADGGVISRPLAAALGAALQCDVQLAEADDAQPLLEYRQLAVGFTLTDAQLRVSGLCDGAPEGTILAGAGGALLAGAAGETIPAVALARALSPSSEFLVPATKETGLLVRVLPVPSANSSPALQAQRHVPVRLQEKTE